MYKRFSTVCLIFILNYQKNKVPSVLFDGTLNYINITV
jgi:hypothetical protein